MPRPRGHIAFADLARCPRELEGIRDECAVGAVERRRGGIRHERKHQALVSREPAEESSVELGAVTAAIVRAHRGGNQLLRALDNATGTPSADSGFT